VRLADGWYFLDPTWAAGYVTDGRFVREWDEEWWLVPPERFERTHYPDDERWALGAGTLATRK
jgi:transglutaminase/protease-like cytokinesis protein 3